MWQYRTNLEILKTDSARNESNISFSIPAIYNYLEIKLFLIWQIVVELQVNIFFNPFKRNRGCQRIEKGKVLPRKAISKLSNDDNARGSV